MGAEPLKVHFLKESYSQPSQYGPLRNLQSQKRQEILDTNYLVPTNYLELELIHLPRCPRGGPSLVS